VDDREMEEFMDFNRMERGNKRAEDVVDYLFSTFPIVSEKSKIIAAQL